MSLTKEYLETRKALYDELARVFDLVQPRLNSYNDLETVPSGCEFSETTVTTKHIVTSSESDHGFKTGYNKTRRLNCKGVPVRFMKGWRKGKPNKVRGVVTTTLAQELDKTLHALWSKLSEPEREAVRAAVSETTLEGVE